MEIPLDAERRAGLESVFQPKSKEGFRVLAVANRRVAARVSLLTELAVVPVLRTHRPAFRSRTSGLLLWSTVTTKK